MDQSGKTILIMTAGGLIPQLMINALAGRFANVVVVQERPESKWLLLKRRARLFGWITALGQLATIITSRLGKSMAKARQAQIIADHGLNPVPDPAVPVVQVSSLNDPECLALVASHKPAVVFTISCRILKSATLKAIPCPVINFHSGINPLYRGQMGGYWALVEGRPDQFGTTVHLVDEGVDTGQTLYQNILTPAANDTMLTYTLLQTAASVDICAQAIEDALNGRLAPYVVGGPSRQRYNPPIWTYVWNGLTKGIW